MAAIQVLFRYPTNIMYEKREGDSPIAYYVTSLFAQIGNQDIDLYREIVRVSDGARQILRTDKAGTTYLYSDKECQLNTLITINHEWTYRNAPEVKKALPHSASEEVLN